MNVSVLIGTYGDREWEVLAQERALPSAQAQNPFEVLIGHEDEGCIAGIRNQLAQKAKGEWLLFLDADDELAPGFLAAMDKAARGHAWAGGKVLLTPAVRQIRGGRPSKPLFFDRGISLHDDNWLILGTLVQRDLFLEVGGFSDYPHGFEDWSLWAKCWKAGAEIVKVREAVYVYYWNRDSVHHRSWRDRKWQIEMHNKVRAELFPELT